MVIVSCRGFLRRRHELPEKGYTRLAGRAEIDGGRIVIRGSGFGTYYGTVAAAGLKYRIKGYCGTGVCQEPGCDTIFNTASPTFKVRFMFMAGYEDEDAFDKFRQEFDLRKIARDITAPYMIVAGEADQLSPIQHPHLSFADLTRPIAGNAARTARSGGPPEIKPDGNGAGRGSWPVVLCR